jgi:replicative DNA helicase
MVAPTEANKGRAELIIAKQRNGPTGTVDLVFLPQFTSFRNPPEAFGDEERE